MTKEVYDELVELVGMWINVQDNCEIHNKGLPQVLKYWSESLHEILDKIYWNNPGAK